MRDFVMQDKANNNNEQAEGKSVTLNFDQQQTLMQQLRSSLAKKNLFILASLTSLLIALYLVIFWLPASIQKPVAAIDAKEIMAQEATKPIDESPWQENQLAKYRRDAQEILSQVLDKQNKLEDRQVHLWANDAFEGALAVAASGDYLYRSQEFSKAMTSYQNTLDQLTTIEQNIPEQFSRYLAKGEKSLAENNAKLAKENLQIAMYLQADTVNTASLAYDRAVVLDQVIALVKEGVVLVDEKDFEQAKQTFEQAYSLDNHSSVVKEQIQIVNELITDRDFSIAMSTGYNSLKNKKYDHAITAFEKARQIKPDATSAVQAIKQSKNERLQAQVSTLLQQAYLLVEQENWQRALAKFNEVLTLDKSIIKAQVGAITATARQKLSTQLNAVIEQPQRLSNQAVFQQALLTQQDALTISNPGLKLKQQIQAINQVIAKARVPVAITIESDNLTVVTLYRNGQLGKFRAKQLTLTPGEYTLVGSRDGFRDVRQNFTLVPDNEHQTIVIQCNEKVTRG